MLQMTYISTARAPITRSHCVEILSASRINNRRVGVSGLLVASDRRFLQALEGPTDAVRATFARIAADPRHYALVILSERYQESRQFGDWAMAFERGGHAFDADDLATQVAKLADPIADANLRAQFIGFAELHARAA